MIAMTMGLIILAVLSSTFLMQRKTYDIQEQIVEMVQTARAAMDMMTREIRMAGYDPTGAGGFDGITHDANHLEIRADLNGTIDGTNERIRYKYETVDPERLYQIRRATGSGHDTTGSWTFQPFAENIELFTFVYLKADGVTEVTTSAENDDIRQIKITIIARTSKADSDYSANGGYRTHTLTSLITPRNLAF